MKTTHLIPIIAFTLMLSAPAFAEDAPPSLNIDFNQLQNNNNDSNSNDAPPDFNFDLGNQGQPADNNNNNNNQNDGGGVGIQITSHKADPRIINPLIQESTITYTINKDALVTVKILNANGQTATNILNNEAQTAGEYSVKWRGTDDNQRNGNIVDNGEYRYKITTANPTTSVITDSQEGTIVISYSSGNVQTSPRAVTFEPFNGQADAMMALQNTSSGRSAETGPEVLIYGLFPVAGYFYSRRKR